MFLKYLFYRLNLYYSKSETGGASKLEAILTISMLMFFYFLIGVIWVDHFTNIDFFEQIEIGQLGIKSIIQGFLIALPFLIINYFLFYKKEKYEQIQFLFKNESKRESYIGGIKVILFVVGSTLLLFLSIFLTKGIKL